jgi:uncharacterized UPF0160 family protein
MDGLGTLAEEIRDRNARETVFTHPGAFHADDAMAVAIILTLRQDDLTIVRAQDPRKHERWEEGYSWVVDVGGEHDPERLLFDHHQDRDGKLCRDPETGDGPYAAAGLVWKHLGARTVDVWLQARGIAAEKNARVYRKLESRSEEIAEAVDKFLIREIDAWDRGVKICDSRVNTFSLVITRMNPSALLGEDDFDEEFDQAVWTSTSVLHHVIKSCVTHILSEDIVRDAIENREDPRIMVLGKFCQWQGHLHRLDEAGEVLYVVFDGPRGWQCWQVAKELGSFEGRKPLPKAWKGLQAEELAALTGVEDAEFCHAGGFVCGARSKEGVLALARLAMENDDG